MGSENSSLAFPPPGNAFKQYARIRSWTTQKPPFTKRLPYTSRNGFATNSGNIEGYSPVVSADSVFLTSIDPRCNTEATAKAYGKFVDAVKRSSNVVVNLAEYRQASDMVAGRATQLIKFARALNRLDFAEACRVLGLSKQAFKGMQKMWSKEKSLANIWLEYHFGWENIVKDIHEATIILTGPIPPSKVRGVGSHTINEKPVNIKGQVEVRSYFGGVSMMADVTVSNPNLRSLVDFGITNPAIWAWELIPFSFVVDWFVNVSQMLGTFDDFFGLSLGNAATTLKAQNYFYSFWGPPRFDPGRVSTARGGGIDRIQGVASPGLHVRPFKGPSVVRAATAISLLTQLLPTH
jgi:hypothetical protein